ncbi:MAG TPA: TolC family protein, partial [Segetibacter sp.]|nr:TolC family protein [Segetibacter sp.]
MMNTIKFLSTISVAITIMLCSCKPLQTIQEEKIKPVPHTFLESKDTTNSASINWKAYFSDSHLTGLIDTAIKNNFDVLIAYQRIQAAQSEVLLTKGALKPFVNETAAAGISKFSAYTMDGAGNKGTEIYNGNDIPTVLPDYFVGLQSTWEIDVWGKLRNRKSAAVARYLADVEGRNWVITNLITEIANSYYELLALDRQLEIIDTTIALQENALEMVKVQKEAARANELAVKQFEGQLIGFKSIRWEFLQQI